MLSYYAVMGGFRVIYDPNHTHPDGVVPAQEGQWEEPRTEPEQSSAAVAVKSAIRDEGNENVQTTAILRNQVVNARSEPCRGKRCAWYARNDTGVSAGTLTPHGVL